MHITNAQEVPRVVNELRQNGGSSSQSLVVALDSRNIQASDVAALITAFPGQQLQSASLSRAIIMSDTLVLFKALSSCRNLKRFTFYDSFVRHSNADMNALGMSLSQLPQLENITMDFQAMESALPWRVPTPILQNPNHVLTTIRLTNFSLPQEYSRREKEHFQAFFVAAGASTQLQHLELMPHPRREFAFRTTAMKSIGQMIQKSSSLKSLKLGAVPLADLVLLAEALCHNNSLESLTIQRESLHTGNYRDNRWAHLYRHRVPRLAAALESWEAFHSTLKDHNFTLKQLYVSFWTPSHYAELIDPDLEGAHAHVKGIDFYLTLNQMGRDKFLGTATKEEWLRMVSSHDDLSVIYYFLQKNPFLVLQCQ